MDLRDVSLARPIVRRLRRIAATSRTIGSAIGGRPADGAVAVSYGHLHVPALEEHAGGGVIKLQHLQRLYPNRAYRFNILYLVSSRLPEGAPDLARAAQRKGARVVLNQNGVAYPAWYGQGWERVNAPMTELLVLADHVFYQSRFCKESADRFAGTAAGAWEVLYNPVDTRAFVPAARPAAALTLLLGGTQTQEYRVVTALDVLARVARVRPDVRLLVTGGIRWRGGARAARRAVEDRARVLRVLDHIEFVGPYTQTDAPAIFQRADILLHTKCNDPCPTVVLEAMASGLPVVYSRSGGVPELVGDDAGIGVPADVSWDRDIPPSAEAMADAVMRIAESPERYRAAARQRAVDCFDVRPWVERHRDLFERLLTS
jgi:glycosyltransferase involved in cell wall biosynthesis